ncbi:unnamed protein product [Gadus morhua 'NCC']
MELLSDVFKDKGGLGAWTVNYPQQWMQTDGDNCGIFVCTAAESDVQEIEMRQQYLTLSNCSQLRKYHAACMIKDLNNQDFPPTQNRMAEMLDREEKLKEAEDKRQSANVHCIAWKNKACIFQRVEGDTKTLHDNIKKFDWVKCADCLCWGHFECFGVQRELASKLFSCGCTKASDPSLAQHISGDPVDSILTDEQIRTLDYGLKAVELCPIVYSYNNIPDMTQTDDLSNRLLTVLSVNPTDVKEVRYTLEVLLPEVISQWLRVQFGMNRYEAECVLLKKTVIPLPPEKKDSVKTNTDSSSKPQDKAMLE